MSVIYLIRHGQASFGASQYDQLSDTGCQQVRILGEYFAGLDLPVHHIYCGTLHRQQQTAQLLAAALTPASPPISIDEAFNEYDSEAILHAYAATLNAAQLEQSGWPGLLGERRRFQPFLERAALAWVEGRLEGGGLPSWQEFHSRTLAALRALMHAQGRSRTLLISTSGGVIGTIVAHVLGVANRLGLELNWAIHNASITRLIYNADRISLSMFNALPHLDQPSLRALITYR